MYLLRSLFMLMMILSLMLIEAVEVNGKGPPTPAKATSPGLTTSDTHTAADLPSSTGTSASPVDAFSTMSSYVSTSLSSVLSSTLSSTTSHLSPSFSTSWHLLSSSPTSSHLPQSSSTAVSLSSQSSQSSLSAPPTTPTLSLSSTSPTILSSITSSSSSTTPTILASITSSSSSTTPTILASSTTLSSPTSSLNTHTTATSISATPVTSPQPTTSLVTSSTMTSETPAAASGAAADEFPVAIVAGIGSTTVVLIVVAAVVFWFWKRHQQKKDEGPPMANHNIVMNNLYKMPNDFHSYETVDIRDSDGNDTERPYGNYEDIDEDFQKTNTLAGKRDTLTDTDSNKMTINGRGRGHGTTSESSPSVETISVRTLVTDNETSNTYDSTTCQTETASTNYSHGHVRTTREDEYHHIDLKGAKYGNRKRTKQTRADQYSHFDLKSGIEKSKNKDVHTTDGTTETSYEYFCLQPNVTNPHTLNVKQDEYSHVVMTSENATGVKYEKDALSCVKHANTSPESVDKNRNNKKRSNKEGSKNETKIVVPSPNGSPIRKVKLETVEEDYSCLNQHATKGPTAKIVGDTYSHISISATKARNTNGMKKSMHVLEESAKQTNNPPEEDYSILNLNAGKVHKPNSRVDDYSHMEIKGNHIRQMAVVNQSDKGDCYNTVYIHDADYDHIAKI